MTEDNYNTWAYIPGHTDVKIQRGFTFFNLLNPDDVKWNGARPLLNVTREYPYYEFDQYIERVYEEYNGTDYEVVKYIRYQYFDPIDDWPAELSGNDLINTINLGSLTVWSQLKNLPYYKLAAPTLATVIQGLDSVFLYAAYSEGLSAIFSSEDQTKLLVFTPAGLTDQEADTLWNDENFGWKNFETLLYWVIATSENQNAQNDFEYQKGAQGTNYMLKSYFGFDDTKMSSILQLLYEYYSITGIAISNAYDCPSISSDQQHCDPHYFTTKQWASQNVTMNPPPPADPSLATPSVAQQNSTISGFPEITYFQSNYYNETNPLRNIEWTMEEGLKLLDYNLADGYPSGTPYTLLDQGHMQDLLDYGRQQDWHGINSLFALNSTQKSQILYDYVINLIEQTALLNQTNSSNQNLLKQGPTEELGIAQLLQQTMQTLYIQLVATLPLYVTQAQAYGDIVLNQKLSCNDVLQQSGITLQTACSAKSLAWTSSDNMSRWMQAYWYGENSSNWNLIKSQGNLSTQDMKTLFSQNSTLYQILSNVDETLYNHYNCTNPSKRCFDQQFFEKQWGSSQITRFPTKQMQLAGLKASNTLMDWNTINTELVYPPEFYVYSNFNGGTGLNQTQSHNLLNYFGILNQVQIQRWFINIMSDNQASLQKLVDQYNLESIQNVRWLTDYFRRMVDAYALNFLFVPQSVNDLLWTGSSKLVQQLAETNPLKAGDPSLDPTLVQLGRNTTELKLGFPEHYKHAMYTGQVDVEDSTRKYHLFYGSPYVKNFIKTYKGNDEHGPIIIQDQIDPWGTPNLKIIGTDGLAFQTNIDSNSDVWVYLDDISRFGKGQFTETVTHKGMKTYRFVLPYNLLQNAYENRDNAIYYQYGPSGLGNLTSVVLGPVFVSKSFFYQADKRVVQALNFTNWSMPDEDDYDLYETFFDIEKYSGANFYCKLQLQTNVELTSDILYPNLGKSAQQDLSINTFMPVVSLNRSADFTYKRVQLIYGQILTAKLLIQIFTIIGYTLGSLLLLVSVIFLIYQCYERRKKPSEDYRTLSVDMEGNTGYLMEEKKDQ